MKRLVVLGLIVILLTACGESKPPYTDNGNPGQIQVTVFYDNNRNGTMDSGETGASARIAITQDASCTPNTPQWESTDSNGQITFKDLKPGKYCVFPEENQTVQIISMMKQEVYVSSDQTTTVLFGVVNP